MRVHGQLTVLPYTKKFFVISIIVLLQFGLNCWGKLKKNDLGFFLFKYRNFAPKSKLLSKMENLVKIITYINLWFPKMRLEKYNARSL